MKCTIMSVKNICSYESVWQDGFKKLKLTMLHSSSVRTGHSVASTRCQYCSGVGPQVWCFGGGVGWRNGSGEGPKSNVRGGGNPTMWPIPWCMWCTCHLPGQNNRRLDGCENITVTQLHLLAVKNPSLNVLFIYLARWRGSGWFNSGLALWTHTCRYALFLRFEVVVVSAAATVESQFTFTSGGIEVITKSWGT